MSNKCALYVDFDNLIIGLSETDPTAAVRFASDPAGWLHELMERAVDGHDRRWLIRRCYLNPNGFIQDPSRVDERERPLRIYFSRLRPLLTSAGFEVVDCPALTARGKNAADIRIVLDVVDALDAAVRYDEFIIVSSDSDFTPLMHRLRAADRRVVAVAAETSSSAYLSVVDTVLTTGDLLGLINAPGPERDELDDAVPEAAEPVRSSGGAKEASQDQFEQFLLDAYAEASAPLNLAALGNAVRASLGDLPTDYYGAGNFTTAIQKVGLEGAIFGPHHLWDPARHDPPVNSSQSQLARLPQVAHQVSAVTGLPRISSDEWASLYEALATFAATQTWNLTESTRWTRDHLMEKGQQVGRGAIGFVVRELSRTKSALNRDPAPTPVEIAEALLTYIISRAEEAGLRLPDDEVRELAEWLSVPTEG